jgi:hypothetical protein
MGPPAASAVVARILDVRRRLVYVGIAMPRITYRSLRGYKYQLMEPYSVETQIAIDANAAAPHGWVKLSKSGRLTLKKGYAWDGPSGPAIDTPDFLRGSLVHDALYQLMRQRLMATRFRKRADVLLWMMCIEDGMPKVRANYVYHAVRAFGAGSARPPRKPRQVRLTAP